MMRISTAARRMARARSLSLSMALSQIGTVPDLSGEKPDEHHVVTQISREKAARLLKGAIEPLQPDTLNPERGSVSQACPHIEGPSHAHREMNAKGVSAPGEKFLFVRTTHPDEKEVGTRRADRGGDLLLATGSKEPIAGASYLEPRMPRANRSHRPL